jgi:predicted nuclease of predicted toxin-antitoxin system
VRFLVDAQLPARLAARLGALGHDAVHTSSLPDGNRTTDQQIAAVADRDGRIVVTKDADFRNSHLLNGSPARLLVVATGNIRNDDLLNLFESRLPEVEAAFGVGDFVELRRGAVISHPRGAES